MTNWRKKVDANASNACACGRACVDTIRLVGRDVRGVEVGAGYGRRGDCGEWWVGRVD